MSKNIITIIMLISLIIVTLILNTSCSQPNITVETFSGKVVAIQKWTNGLGGNPHTAIFFESGNHTSWIKGNLVIDIGEHYIITIKGTPNRKYLWGINSQ